MGSVGQGRGYSRILYYVDLGRGVFFGLLKDVVLILGLVMSNECEIQIENPKKDRYHVSKNLGRCNDTEKMPKRGKKERSTYTKIE